MKAVNAIKRLEKAGYVRVLGDMTEGKSENIEYEKEGKVIGFTKNSDGTLHPEGFWVTSNQAYRSPTFGFKLTWALKG